MSRRGLALTAIAAAAAILAGGCAASGDGRGVTRFPPPERVGQPPAERVPSPRSTFDYLVQNDDCRCREYSTADRRHPVAYRFEASYRMEEGFITRIRVTFENRSRSDTLFLDPGSVRVASRNIEYQYNNRFLPLPDMAIRPGDSGELDLDGREITESPTWKRIAGERMTLTLRGLRLGETVLADQNVTFVPENPLLSEPR